MGHNQEEHPGFIYASPREMREGYCVYTHSKFINGAPIVIYASACKMSEVYTHREAYLHSGWQALVSDDTQLVIEILFTCDTVQEAHQYLRDYIRNRCGGKTLADKYGSFVGNHRGIVTCSTGPNAGKTYENATQAAAQNGITQPAMSNHLNGKPGYGTIHGMTFRRGL